MTKTIFKLSWCSVLGLILAVGCDSRGSDGTWATGGTSGTGGVPASPVSSAGGGALADGGGGAGALGGGGGAGTLGGFSGHGGASALAGGSAMGRGGSLAGMGGSSSERTGSPPSGGTGGAMGGARTTGAGATAIASGTARDAGAAGQGGAGDAGTSAGACQGDYSWPPYSPVIAYDYVDEYGTLAPPSKLSKDCNNIEGSYSKDWWAFYYGPDKNKLVTSAAWIPMIDRFNADFAYISDTMRWPRDSRARAGFYSAVYLFGSGLCTDKASNTELGGWMSSVGGHPMVLASYYPV